MLATDVNKLGKVEKNSKVKSGHCIFPFKYKYEEHNKCVDTNKGQICATEVNPKTNTLVKYGYCQTESPKMPKKRNSKKGTQKKALRTSKSVERKLKSKSKLSKSSSRNSLKSRSKAAKIPTKTTMKRQRRKLVPVENLKITEETKQEEMMPESQPPSQPSQPQQQAKVYNEEFIEVLGELAGIMQRQGEPFRARAYQKAQETLMTFEGDITSAKQVEGLPGIGKTIMAKLDEYEKTGTIAALERERKNPMNVLTNIYGVGPKKAQQLIKDGFDTIEKIKALSPQEIDKMFNANQKKGLEYYDDINQKIPRAEIVEFDKVFAEAIKECCGPRSRYEIVGSYRRGKTSSGDIDVIITNEDNDKTVFDGLLNTLKEQGVLEYTFSKGPTKSLTMCRLTPSTEVSRRVDFLYTSPEEFPFAILYFTGSKIFNTVMRQRALKQGYTLNEHGISHMKAGVKGAKVEHKFKTEKDIFDFLGMKYKEPNERIDGRAVQDKTTTSTPTPMPTSTLIQPEKAPVEPVEAPIPSTIITNLKEVAQPIQQAKQEPAVKPKKVVVRRTLKKQKPKYEEMAKKFKSDGVSYLEGLTETELVNLINEANDAYYNKKPFLSDEEFDIIKEHAESRFPENIALKAIGAPVEKGKVKLPFNMPSMNKIKPDTGALAKWKAVYKGPYVLSAKLDGVSGMFVSQGGKVSLYTRGDGTYGQDVTHMLPYLGYTGQYLALPMKLPGKVAIRGEFIIPKKTFSEKYAGEFSNPRNFVAGVVNSKTKVLDRYSDIHFIAYEVIEPQMKPSEQFDTMNKLGLRFVSNKFIENPSDLTNDLLSNELVKQREKYEYEIDGIIVADDHIYPRTPENPEHAFAFKMVLGDQVAEVKVLDVLWSPSKDGYLKPRVQVEPVVLGGAKIEYATGFNAKFIEDNKIGVGAIIKLVRSGDVIPHIMGVVKPAEQAMMPNVAWKWNPTQVDAVLEDKSQDETVNIKTITLFFKHLDTAGMGPGNVAKIVKSGLTTIPKIIHADVSTLQSILGKKMGQTVKTNIVQSIETSTLPQLMTATNIFGRGFGEKRFTTILTAIPDVLTHNYVKEQLATKVAQLKGMSQKTADDFVDNLPEFLRFMDEAKLTDKLAMKIEEKGDVGHPLFGKKIVMTGFRDKELTAMIESNGGEMAGSVSKNTFVVLVKDKDEDTGKADQARKLGIPLMTPDEFKQTYLQ
jgi:NAD-dependent DNA ligase